MTFEFQKLVPEAVTPSRAHTWDAAFDLCCTSIDDTSLPDTIIYHTGIAINMPRGYAGLLMMRSSVRKHPLMLANAVGLIDPGFQGELCFSFRRYYGLSWLMGLIRDMLTAPFTSARTVQEKADKGPPGAYEVGDKVGQIMFIPTLPVEFQEVHEFAVQSARSGKGHGSSGR